MSSLICPACQSHQVFVYKSSSTKGEKELGKCYNCTHQWDLRFKCSEDAIKAQIISEIAASFPTKMPNNFSWHYKVRQNILKFKPEGGNLLDIGSNNGLFLKYMEDNFQCYGIELSPKLADISRSLTKAEINQIDIMNSALPDSYFDVITCFAVIEHIYDVSTFLEKVYSLLKPGGILIVSTGDIASFVSQLFNSEWPLLTADDHVHFFTSRSLKKILEIHNFLILSLEWRLWNFPNHKLIFSQTVKQTIKFMDVFNLGIQYIPFNDVMFVTAQKTDK